jgi:secreted trypsin-like serine protease
MDEEHIIHELPWVVSVNAIQQDGSTEKICDGTVISSEVVLTSATCVHRNGELLLEDEIILEMGRPDPTYDSVNDLEGQIIREVKAFIMHPTFKVTDDNKYIPDFAMVVMANPVRFDVNATDSVLSVCNSQRSLPSESNSVSTGMLVTWSTSMHEGKVRQVPQQQLVPVLSKKACSKSNDLADDTFCSGKVNEKSFCSVKPGSALMMRGAKGWELRGIVSKNLIDPTTKACNMDESFVFTHLNSDWIAQTVEEQKSLPLIEDINN